MVRRLLSVILNFTFIGILSVTVSGLAVAQSDQQYKKTANYWMPFCRQAAKGNYHQGDAFMNGVCVGLIMGLGQAGTRGVCAPEGVTPDQAVRVVVQYVDQRPARTNESFGSLALEALRDAWPCNH